MRRLLHRGVPLHGLIAEFESPAALIEAAGQAHAAGYRKMDAFTPYPIEELSEALHFHTRLPLIVLIGGILIAASGVAWATAVWAELLPRHAAVRRESPAPSTVAARRCPGCSTGSPCARAARANHGDRHLRARPAGREQVGAAARSPAHSSGSPAAG